jgi:hypothetical protein
MEAKHLVITCTLIMNDEEIPTHPLIDCGATGIAFMCQDYASHHQLPHQELKEMKQIKVIDGRPIELGDITHVASVGMGIHDHKEQLPMFITKLGHVPIFLEIPWLQLHDLAVRFPPNIVTFGSQYCTTHCHDAPVTVQGVTEDPPVPDYLKKVVFKQQTRPQWPLRENNLILNGASFFRTVKRRRLTVFKASLYDINKAIEVKNLKERPL